LYLDQQITNGCTRRRRQTSAEVHMAQTLEEAVYLESMMDVLDSVQAGKRLQPVNCSSCTSEHQAQREANAKREDNRAAHGLCDTGDGQIGGSVH
jgi:hypothetical protein